MRTIFTQYDRYFVISYLPNYNEVVQTHFVTEESARACKNKFTVGMWKIKESKTI